MTGYYFLIDRRANLDHAKKKKNFISATKAKQKQGPDSPQELHSGLTGGLDGALVTRGWFCTPLDGRNSASKFLQLAGALALCPCHACPCPLPCPWFETPV
jgi:hypothetical protein